jgi:hypothetical protein
VDAALDHSSHRDRAGGRRITVSTSEELQKTVDELAGTPGRPTRSNGGQHHAVVTPHVEASPDRSDFAKLGETIAASLVQAQEHANHASVLLEQTKQSADDIRSQVAEKSSELVELNERGGSIGTNLALSTSVLRGANTFQDATSFLARATFLYISRAGFADLGDPRLGKICGVCFHAVFNAAPAGLHFGTFCLDDAAWGR